MENPILNQGPLPVFNHIQPEQIEPTVKQIITESHKTLAELLAENKKYTWDNLVVPLDEMSDKLSKMWSPVSHLHSVKETEELRTAYNACLPILTEYHTEFMQNEALYKAIQMIAESPEYKKFNQAQHKVIEDDLRNFRLSGVGLPAADKARYAELQKELTKLTTKFSENILDATHAWSLNVTDINTLKGLPESALTIAKQTAEHRGETGWTLTLDYPCYSAAIKFLVNRELRWLMYEAYVTRASDQGPQAGRYDNTQVMEDILKLRHELACLLGFANFAEYSLATKMAKKPEQVMNFLLDLVSRSKKAGQKEMQELTDFAKSLDHIERLEPWDMAYYSEKLREKQYAISQEELRPYFPITKVLEGMFTVVNKLFGIRIVERNDVDVWDPHVQFFEIFDDHNNLRGCFYTDFFARPHKRDGAWMDESRVRRILPDGKVQTPVAFLTCNFTRPIGDKPSYLTHDEVQTVFHEFGHCLHHLMTKVDYASVSGINGVPWDAVEFPSQFLENWCWDKDTLELISQHEVTGESLPDSLFNKLIAAKNFHAGMFILRQLEFALFDFRLHLEFDPRKGAQVQSVIDEVRRQVTVVPVSSFNRFQHSFSHIFAGGYAAGYYSYAWAEVLAADAFSRFEEEGVLNSHVGHEFLAAVLEQGGTREPMELFVEFRGREPKIDAFLKQSGLVV